MPTIMDSATHLRCPTCGQTHPPKKVGIIVRLRVGGEDSAPTRVLDRCVVCDKLKFLISEPSGQAPRPVYTADREMTLQELAAYVGEGTMAIETAESIARASCPEARKRHIAALVAEGVLSPADALRLLAM